MILPGLLSSRVWFWYWQKRGHAPCHCNVRVSPALKPAGNLQCSSSLDNIHNCRACSWKGMVCRGQSTHERDWLSSWRINFWNTNWILKDFYNRHSSHLAASYRTGSRYESTLNKLLIIYLAQPKKGAEEEGGEGINYSLEGTVQRSSSPETNSSNR